MDLLPQMQPMPRPPEHTSYHGVAGSPNTFCWLPWEGQVSTSESKEKWQMPGWGRGWKQWVRGGSCLDTWAP